MAPLRACILLSFQVSSGGGRSLTLLPPWGLRCGELGGQALTARELRERAEAEVAAERAALSEALAGACARVEQLEAEALELVRRGGPTTGRARARTHTHTHTYTRTRARACGPLLGIFRF